MRLLIILFFLAGRLYGQLHPGTDIESFKSAYPGVVPSKIYFNEDISFDEALQSFAGSWYFNFQQDTLKELYFSANLGKQPDTESMMWFRFLKEDYSDVFGSPVGSKFTDTVFVQGRKRNTSCDTMIEYVWQAHKTLFTMGIYYTGTNTGNVGINSPEQVNAPVNMNYYLFKVNCLPSKVVVENPQWDIFIGMTIQEFYQRHSALFPNGLGVYGQWSRKVNYYGITSDEYYNFENSKLTFVNWSYYSPTTTYGPTTNSKEFRICNSVYQKKRAELIKKYGNPENSVVTDKKQQQAILSKRQSATIAKDEWTVDGYKIELKLMRTVGKGDDYFYLNYHEE